jgi:hypothetical protein
MPIPKEKEPKGNRIEITKLDATSLLSAVIQFGVELLANDRKFNGVLLSSAARMKLKTANNNFRLSALLHAFRVLETSKWALAEFRPLILSLEEGHDHAGKVAARQNIISAVMVFFVSFETIK